MAVAETTTWPGVSAPAQIGREGRTPEPFVVTLTKAQIALAFAVGCISPVVLAKNSTRYMLLAALVKLPTMLIVPPPELALVSTGKFCVVVRPGVGVGRVIVSGHAIVVQIDPQTAVAVDAVAFDRIAGRSAMQC